jgi:hypothetical protein
MIPLRDEFAATSSDKAATVPALTEAPKAVNSHYQSSEAAKNPDSLLLLSLSNTTGV